LNENPLWKHCFEGILSIFEVVKGDAHVDVVGRMFHDVVHQGAPNPAKCEVDSRGNEGLGSQPFGFFVIPRNRWVGMVYVNYKTNHAVPEQEWQRKAGNQTNPNRLASC